MGWADRIIAKLPTMRGIGAFIYVATNWPTISHDLEEYRRQIKDREEWAKAMLRQQEGLHKLEQERLQKEKSDWADRADIALDLAKESVATAKELVQRLAEVRSVLEQREDLLKRLFLNLVDFITLLAQVLSGEPPLSRAILLSTLSPMMRELVERTMEKLPPPESPIPGLADLANIRALWLSEILGPLPIEKKE